MSGGTPNRPRPSESNLFDDEPRSPALRRLLFSVGAWITAATLTAVGSLSTTILDDSAVMTWLVSQLAPGVLALLTIGLVFSLVAGLVRLRDYRKLREADAIDTVGPPPPASPIWRPDKPEKKKFALDRYESAFDIDPERVYRIDVRGVRADRDLLWWDTADRILMALGLPSVGLSAGSDDQDEKNRIASLCAEAVGKRALLVLDREPDAKERTAWLLQKAFTDVRSPDPEAPGARPYLLVLCEQPNLKKPSEPATDQVLLQAFASLPVDVLDTEGLTALNNEIAVFMESVELPNGVHYSPTRALDVARRYCGLHGLASDYRFQLSEQLRQDLWTAWKRDESAPLAAGQAVRASTSWVLRHYAMLSTAWCRDLGVPDRAPVAARWFRTNEPLLRTLVLQPHARRRAGSGQESAEQLWLVLDDLARIADALDVWYRREHQARLACRVAKALREHADLLDHPTLRELARLRLSAAERASGAADGQPAQAEPRTRRDAGRHPRRVRASLNARRLHDQAITKLRHLPAPDADDQSEARNLELLKALEHELRKAWLWLPRKDLVGAVTILINLSIVHLRQGRLQPARDRLELAESLAVAANDASAHARALELRGVVSWSEGHGSEAMREWEQARQRYRELGERYGEGRCCQHLGSAVVHSPAMAAIGLAESEVSREQAVRYADRMLTTARRALGNDEGALASHYLVKLRARYGSQHDRPRTDRPLIDQAEAEQTSSAWTTGRAGPDSAPSIERILRDIRKLIRQWRTNLPRS